DTQYDFLTSSVMGGNYFFSIDFSYFLHPTYFGIYIVFAQYLLFELSKVSSNHWEKRCLPVLYVFFTTGLFFLSSKAALISFMFVAFWILVQIKVGYLLKASTILGFLAI